MPTTKHRPPSKEERAARRATERELMEEAITELRSSEGWRRWLSLRRHFHAYSLHNQLLIALQMPDATRVAGFHAWLKLGYAVRKGETAIHIWAPCRPSRKKMREWRDAGADPESEPRIFFRLVAVFDRSQVEPLPDFPGGAVALDPPIAPIDGDGLADRVPPLVELADSLELEVSIEPVPGAASGYHEPATGRIVVEAVGPRFSPNAQVSVLLHELAHALVRLDRREEDPGLSYAEEEVVVECVAYTVCGTVGLDTSGASVPYMAGWGDGGEIARYAGLIDRLASRLEDAALASGDRTPT